MCYGNVMGIQHILSPWSQYRVSINVGSYRSAGTGVTETRDAAHVCRVANILGTLETSKLEDALVAEGDPMRPQVSARQVALFAQTIDNLLA